VSTTLFLALSRLVEDRGAAHVSIQDLAMLFISRVDI